MSIFDRFENSVERGVNGVFSRIFPSGLKPVDIYSAIRRSMDDNVSPVSEDRIIAPNHFTVHLAPTDLEKLGEELAILGDEFAHNATDHAVQQEYGLLGPVKVDFVASDTEMTGHLEVDASTQRGPAAPATNSVPSPSHPIIDINGERWLLTEPVTVLGRGSESDIVINDSGVSRRHVELRLTNTGVIATDLGSTNGTWVEGHRVDAATLLDGNQIVIGHTRIMFWTHPADDGGRP